MSDYKNEKIKEVIKKIGNNDRIMLPSIQRKYVWKEEQIIKFIDSILLGYPIGTFLFWKLEGSVINQKQYRFYTFRNKYDEREVSINDKLMNPENNVEYYAVLDGQQRLTSLYIALKGKIVVKKKKHLSNKSENYVEKKLYINLLSNPASKNEEDETYYDLKFLSEEEVTQETDKKWFELGRIIQCKDDGDIFNFKKEYRVNEEENEIIQKNLNKLYLAFCREEKINYYEIQKDNLEDVLDIFVRVNSGGTVLNKTDLLFSTIVSYWEQARDEVDELLTVMNRKDKGGIFKFNNDFIMRASLYLTDQSIETILKNFNQRTVENIKDNWNNIENALKKTVSLVERLGFNHENITSYNAIMPLAYYIYKGGYVSENMNDETTKELFKYLVVAQVQQVFGGASNTILKEVRETLIDENTHRLKNRKFALTQLKDKKFSGNKSFKVDKEIIEGWFDLEFSDYTFMILSLIYKGYSPYSQQYHQDHMHPNSELNKYQEFRENKDKLANLQLLDGLDNEIKGKMSLKKWLENPENVERAQILPKNISYNIEDFNIFYEARKALILKELLKKFDLE